MKTNRSAQMRARWAAMSSEERDARIALLTGLWEDPEARNRLSRTMTELWADYKDSSLYRQRLRDVSAAKRA